MALIDSESFEHDTSPTIDQRYPIDWVPYRQVQGMMFLLPPVGIVWKGQGSSQTSIHLCISPWLRQSDGRVSLLEGNTANTVCRIVISAEDLWYGMMAYYPVGWDLIPALPKPDQPVCLKCLQWLNGTRYHLGPIGKFIGQPGHIRERTISTPSYHGETKGIAITDLIRKGNPTYDGEDQSVDPLDDAAVESEADDDLDPGSRDGGSE